MLFRAALRLRIRIAHGAHAADGVILGAGAIHGEAIRGAHGVEVIHGVRGVGAIRRVDGLEAIHGARGAEAILGALAATTSYASMNFSDE